MQEVAVTPGELLADADLIHYTLGASEKDEEEAIRKALIGPAYPSRGASGKGNWDPPKYTTCRGWPVWDNPTYSAFWSVFGVTCLRLQRLASAMGFGTTAGLGTQEEPAVFGSSLVFGGLGGIASRAAPEATPRPPSGHPQAIWWLTGRHPEATLRLPAGYPQATLRLP